MIRRLHAEGSGNVLGYEVRGKLTEEKLRTISEELSTARYACSSGCARYPGWSSAPWLRT